MPRPLHRSARARTCASSHPRRGHHKTISRILRSGPTQDNRMARRWMTPLGKDARDPWFPIHPVLPASAHLESCIICGFPPIRTSARNAFRPLLPSDGPARPCSHQARMRKCIPKLRKWKCAGRLRMSKPSPLVVPLQEDARPAIKILDSRIGKRVPSDPRKTPTRLGRRLLPQVPAPSSRTRHTARPR